MEKGGRQLFIFPEESGGLDGEEETQSERELTPIEKIKKDLLVTDLQKLEKEFGKISNLVLFENGYYRKDRAQEKKEHAQQEADWINEFAGEDIVRVYQDQNSEKYRMTYISQSSEGKAAQAA